jgi:two-component system, OmpR family, response regulator SaeR
MPTSILILDDEPDFTELMSAHLSFHDYEVDSTNDPKNMDGMIGKKKYSLIITDLMMPGIDGFEVVRRVRVKDGYKEIPMIVLSAKTLSDDERKMLLQNNVHFVTKPFEPQGLVDKIKELIGSSQ